MKFLFRAMAIVAALCWGSIGTALSSEIAKGLCVDGAEDGPLFARHPDAAQSKNAP